jgi:hypothetical protein
MSNGMSEGAHDPPWLDADAIAIASMLLASHRRAWGRPLVAGAGPHRSCRQAAQGR